MKLNTTIARRKAREGDMASPSIIEVNVRVKKDVGKTQTREFRVLPPSASCILFSCLFIRVFR